MVKTESFQRATIYTGSKAWELAFTALINLSEPDKYLWIDCKGLSLKKIDQILNEKVNRHTDAILFTSISLKNIIAMVYSGVPHLRLQPKDYPSFNAKVHLSFVRTAPIKGTPTDASFINRADIINTDN